MVDNCGFVSTQISSYRQTYWNDQNTEIEGERSRTPQF